MSSEHLDLRSVLSELLDECPEHNTVEEQSWLVEQIMLTVVSPAWDEGYEVGCDDADFAHLGISTDPEAATHPHSNPYDPETKPAAPGC